MDFWDGFNVPELLKKETTVVVSICEPSRVKEIKLQNKSVFKALVVVEYFDKKRTLIDSVEVRTKRGWGKFRFESYPFQKELLEALKEASPRTIIIK